jgi:K+-sensing histidine kinase KdpD
MKNIMVCVTQQRTCDRLIKCGRDILVDDDGELIIMHVARYQFKFLGNSEEGEALDYLYEKAMEYGASLTVIRSNNVLETLVKQVIKNDVSHVIIGETRELIGPTNIINQLREQLTGKAELVEVPMEAF